LARLIPEPFRMPRGTHFVALMLKLRLNSDLGAAEVLPWRLQI